MVDFRNEVSFFVFVEVNQKRGDENFVLKVEEEEVEVLFLSLAWRNREGEMRIFIGCWVKGLHVERCAYSVILPIINTTA